MASAAAVSNSEARRLKILANSEERMRKLRGFSKEESVKPLNTVEQQEAVVNNTDEIQQSLCCSEVRQRSSLKLSTSPRIENPPEIRQNMESLHSNNHSSSGCDGHISHAEQCDQLPVSSAEQNSLVESDPTNSKTDGDVNVDQKSSTASQSHSLHIRRTVGFAFLGLIVRLSLMYEFGSSYVQSIMNPFIATEIILIGYQRAMNVDLGSSFEGGVWLSALQLTGVDEDIIHRYKYWVGALFSAVDDFIVYLFTFVVVHILI